MPICLGFFNMVATKRQRSGFTARKKRLKSRVEWFEGPAFLKIKTTLAGRVALAGQLVRDDVVVSLSRPVTKFVKKTNPKKDKDGQKSRTVVKPGSRSKPGQYPKAETTRLMKSITYSQVGLEARIGTNVDYGLLHETRDRPFLSRSLKKLRKTIKRILLQKIVP